MSDRNRKPDPNPQQRPDQSVPGQRPDRASPNPGQKSTDTNRQNNQKR